MKALLGILLTGHAAGQKFLKGVTMTGLAHEGKAQCRRAKQQYRLCPRKLLQHPSIALVRVLHPPLHSAPGHGQTGARATADLSALGPRAHFCVTEKEVLLSVTSTEILLAQWSRTGLTLRSKSDPE